MVLFLSYSCTDVSNEINENPIEGGGEDTETPDEPVAYESLYDAFKDEGQYYIPTLSKIPTKFWNCSSGVGGRNDINLTDINGGLQWHLLLQSMQGLSQKSLEEGNSSTVIWMEMPGMQSYSLCKNELIGMGIREIGTQKAIELACNDYSKEGEQVKNIWKGEDNKYGYILTDIKNNPESGNVASVAAHVYNSVIVDVRDKEYFDQRGYVMRYDARQKTTLDSWIDFKDKCNNKALVVMPVHTGELRSYAIAHKLFVINLNKTYGTPKDGQNTELLKEILEWLEPNAPVLGWEQGVSEDAFVVPVTKSGNPMIPYDWAYNTDLTALNYKNKQNARITNENPLTYDYDESKNYVSFYLSDGDNVQWAMNSLDNEKYYKHSDVEKTKMSFGLPICNLSMIAPAQLDHLINSKNKEISILETFGCGYYYVDEFGMDKNRNSILRKVAQNTASHMRQRNCKILATAAISCKSNAAKKAYNAFIKANDQLEGIIAIQYEPYTGGNGEILWFSNSKGIDIPVIFIKYAIWAYKGVNLNGHGTPAYVADGLNRLSGGSYSAVCIHAWSSFYDAGDSKDLTIESRYPGDVVGAGAAQQCIKRLNSSFKVVSIHELIWQVRMRYRAEQTKKVLKGFKLSD